MNYSEYKEKYLKRLEKEAGMNWDKGEWSRTGKKVDHILPLNGNNTKENRAAAILKYLKFDCRPWLPGLKGLHQYAHHLNSSQLLCLMFFSQMIGEDMKASEKLVDFIYTTLGVKISKDAKCSFEYTEKFEPYRFNVGGKVEYEGTSFDFHIKDGDIQIYFEIKLTEQGFGKVKHDPNDVRHKEKAEQYINLLRELNLYVTEESTLANYQILRNVARARDKNSYVIFLTDKNNPATNKGIEEFEKQFGKLPNVKFKTWQEAMGNYKCELPFQLEALNAKDTSL